MLLLSACYLAPVTSDSVVEGSRFVTAVFAQMGAALVSGRRSATPIKMNCLLIQIDVSGGRPVAHATRPALDGNQRAVTQAQPAEQWRTSLRILATLGTLLAVLR